MLIYLFIPLGKYLFIWRHQILFAESSIFRCSTQHLFFSYSMWDQVPLGIKPRSPALGHGVLATGPQGSPLYILNESYIPFFNRERPEQQVALIWTLSRQPYGDSWMMLCFTVFFFFFLCCVLFWCSCGIICFCFFPTNSSLCNTGFLFMVMI